jgi:hypothetical protein
VCRLVDTTANTFSCTHTSTVPVNTVCVYSCRADYVKRLKHFYRWEFDLTFLWATKLEQHRCNFSCFDVARFLKPVWKALDSATNLHFLSLFCNSSSLWFACTIYFFTASQGNELIGMKLASCSSFFQFLYYSGVSDTFPVLRGGLCWVWISAGEEICSCPKLPDRLLDPPSLLYCGYQE